MGEMVEKRKVRNENGQNEGLIIPDSITFSEFVDTLGRVGVLAIRMTPGSDQKYGNGSKRNN